MSSFYFFLVACFHIWPSLGVFGGSHEARLLTKLLEDYQIYERPVLHESKPVELVFGISLQQIIDLDERNQLLKSLLWLDYNWVDEYLRWNKVYIKSRVSEALI